MGRSAILTDPTPEQVCSAARHFSFRHLPSQRITFRSLSFPLRSPCVPPACCDLTSSSPAILGLYWREENVLRTVFVRKTIGSGPFPEPPMQLICHRLPETVFRFYTSQGVQKWSVRFRHCCTKPQHTTTKTILKMVACEPPKCWIALFVPWHGIKSSTFWGRNVTTKKTRHLKECPFERLEEGQGFQKEPVIF